MNIIIDSTPISDIQTNVNHKPSLVSRVNAIAFARNYMMATIVNHKLRASIELSQLQRCNCWLTSDGCGGFAITSAGCIIALFDTNDNLSDQLSLIDDALIVGGWRFAD
jgi:hypothetical protein